MTNAEMKQLTSQMDEIFLSYARAINVLSAGHEQIMDRAINGEISSTIGNVSFMAQTEALLIMGSKVDGFALEKYHGLSAGGSKTGESLTQCNYEIIHHPLT